LVLQINFVNHGNDVEIVFDCCVPCGDGLGFYSLERIGEKQRALTAIERAGNFILEVNVSGGINQIEFVFLSPMFYSHCNRTGLNRYPTLPLEFHIVENLLLHFALLNSTSVLEQPVSQGTLAMIDVRDNAKVSDILGFDFGHAMVNLNLS
jgi:hypothetical protein